MAETRTIHSDNPRQCVNLTVEPDHLMTADVRSLVFTIDAQDGDHLYQIGSKSLTVKIQDSDSK